MGVLCDAFREAVAEPMKSLTLSLIVLVACGDPPVDLCYEPQAILGVVVDENNTPIEGASVSIGDWDLITDEAGEFESPVEDHGAWVHVEAAGYFDRSRIAGIGEPIVIKLYEATSNRALLTFGGDTMFSRRMFDADEDGNMDDGLITEGSEGEDIDHLLSQIAPFFRAADFASLNFEGVMTTLSEPSDHQEYPLAAPVESAAALHNAGIDLVALGNNHAMDFGATGASDTLRHTAAANLASVGVGENLEAAWTPYTTILGGEVVAFLSCAIYAEIDTEPVVATATSSGIAVCTNDELRSAIIDARVGAEMVIVQLHGGLAYTDSASWSMETMARVATEAGAGLVIGHGPHTLHGADNLGQGTIFWSLGNLVYEQTLWSTMESGVLSVIIDPEVGHPVHAFFEPIYADNFQPRPSVGQLQQETARQVMGKSSILSTINDGVVEFDFSGEVWEKRELYEVEGNDGENWGKPLLLGDGWVSAMQTEGDWRVGRERLLVGDFEEVDVDIECGEGSLWHFSHPRAAISEISAYLGDGEIAGRGLSYTATPYTFDNVSSRPAHRIPVEPGAENTFTAMVRGDGQFELRAHYYEDSSSDSINTDSFTLDVTEEWSFVQIDTETPEGATFMLPAFTLVPVGRDAWVDLDEVKMYSWESGEIEQPERFNVVQMKSNGAFWESQLVR